MLKKNKLTKQVWFDNLLWKVEQVISTNKYQDFLVLSRDSECVNEDNSPSMDIILIDCHNEYFYPNTQKIRDAIKKRKEADKRRDTVLEENDELLSESYISLFVDNNS